MSTPEQAQGALRVSAVTPEVRKHDRRRARKRAVQHWFRCQWGRTGYRPTMRLLHRLNLCWMEPLPLRDGAHGQWVNVWCHWCGVRGKRLDMARACTPNCVLCKQAEFRG